MARKPRTDDAQPVAPDFYSSQPQGITEIIDDSAELVNMTPIRPSAVDRDGPPPADVPALPQFRVVESKQVMNRGCRMLLRAGKVVDGANYDLESLRSQGVRLSEEPPA